MHAGCQCFLPPRRGRLVTGVISLAICTAWFATGSALGASAVAQHKGRLDPPVVVWCIEHPEKFKIAAQAHGIQVGDSQDTRELSRNGKPIELMTWAELSDSTSVKAFETACETAFAAFSRSALDVALDGVRRGVIARTVLHEIAHAKSDGGIFGVSPDAEAGFGGILAGVLLTALGGAVGAHNRKNQDDKARLDQLATNFRTAVTEYLADQRNETIGRAKVAATALQAEITAWTEEQAATEATDAITQLDALVSTPPCIGNPGPPGVMDADAFRQKINKQVSDVDANVAQLGQRVGRRRRFEGRKPPS
jgi:hypothetical protein